MTISSTDLALTTARVNCARVGAARVGFIPNFVEDTGEYKWDEVKPPTTQWTLLYEGPVCGKRPVAAFSMTGETEATSTVMGLVTVVVEGEAVPQVGFEVVMTVDGEAWPDSALTDAYGYYRFEYVPEGAVVVGDTESVLTNNGTTDPPDTLVLDLAYDVDPH